MDKIKDLTMELAKNLREKGLNFAIVVESEDGEVYSQHSTREGSSIDKVCKSLKDIICDSSLET